MNDRASFYYPQVCIRCGAWMRKHGPQDPTACDECGHDNSIYLEFYQECSAIEGLLQDDARAYGRLRSAYVSPLAHGWLPDILAVISAFFLGILTNASYDAIKGWILGRRSEYGTKYGSHWEFDRAVEAVLEFMIDNMGKIKQFKFTDNEVSVRFEREAGNLRNRIEAGLSVDDASADAPRDDA